ncbi:c-type cytochrome biogenesis protein CcmI [Devosia sp.]|uniref:c-type cytochrome biogenesis protein CcmI n=1 Tax=Devosia sp. TaxID=1871048 RepID=UPI003A937B92
MMFWSLALVVTAVATAALYYAGVGRTVNAGVSAPEREHLRKQLAEIEADIAQGRLGEAEGVAAKAELAREAMRLKDKAETASAPARSSGGRGLVAVAALATAILALGTYSLLGHPELPSEPLAQRELPPAELSLDDAIAQIEKRLATDPDDLRGWTVITPVYMQTGRYEEAAAAIRRIIALDGATADRETDLGEALMMANGGTPTDDALALFESAAARDPAHVRSRYYLASNAMRTGDYADARSRWQAMIDMAPEGAEWLEAARAGLAAAEDGLAGIDSGTDAPAIRNMVEGLSERLAAEGGTIEEWTRLVRSRLVLGETDKAQAAYEAARAAYPDAGERIELDVLAADNGLMAK